MYDLVVKGGRVAVEDDLVECDIGIEDGRIAELNTDLSGRNTIDAARKWVLPGGVDSHCHLDQPAWGSALSADDFRSGSLSAAFGGITSIIPFAMPGPGMSTLEAFERAHSRSAGQSIIDYGLHAVATMSSGAQQRDHIRQLAGRGVTSVKVFMTFDELRVSDGAFLQVLETARELGLLVMVHAENDATINWARESLITAGKTEMRYHTVAHSEAMEREATHRAATLAELTGARLIVLHVSCRQAAEEVVRARARGVDIVGETCPQYLFLSAANLDQPLPAAARYIFAPPPRTRESQQYLWQALSNGDLQLWSSDHSPYSLRDKIPNPEEPVFYKAVSGIPGLESSLPLLFSEGLITKRISLSRYLDLASRNAADFYGLSHVKGRIALGLDADLALWDPSAKWTICSEKLHSNVDYTPFEGHDITGKPVSVIVRGTPVVSEGELLASPGHGRFLERRPQKATRSSPILERLTPWLD